MPASPDPDALDYSQGWAPPPFNWTDRARAAEVGQKTSVEAGDYENVLVTEEYNEEEPGAIQLKYYAPDVGNVRIGWAGDDTQQEQMELVAHGQLDEGALAKVRQEALELEARAYLYADTPPAEQNP